jgi:hypothetical protein
VRTDDRLRYAAIEIVGVRTLTGFDRNARTHSPEQVAQLAAAIDRFGYLPNLDPFVYPVNDFDMTYASFDLGKTWQRVQTWGARGSTKPTSPRPPGAPDYAELASCRPLFVT